MLIKISLKEGYSLQEEALQQPAAEALAEVIVQCVGRKPSPNEKLIKNLCALTCADPVETPKATLANAVSVNMEENEAAPVGKGSKNSKGPLLSASEERSRLEGAITRRGAELALKSLCVRFGSSLLDQLPKLWDCLTEGLGQPATSITNATHPSVLLPALTADPQALITNLQVSDGLFCRRSEEVLEVESLHVQVASFSFSDFSVRVEESTICVNVPARV